MCQLFWSQIFPLSTEILKLSEHLSLRSIKLRNKRLNSQCTKFPNMIDSFISQLKVLWVCFSLQKKRWNLKILFSKTLRRASQFCAIIYNCIFIVDIFYFIVAFYILLSHESSTIGKIHLLKMKRSRQHPPGVCSWYSASNIEIE